MNIKTISLTGLTLALAASAFADPPADQVIRIGDKTGYSILLANPKVDDVVVVERSGCQRRLGGQFPDDFKHRGLQHSADVRALVPAERA